MVNTGWPPTRSTPRPGRSWRPSPTRRSPASAPPRAGIARITAWIRRRGRYGKEAGRSASTPRCGSTPTAPTSSRPLRRPDRLYAGQRRHLHTARPGCHRDHERPVRWRLAGRESGRRSDVLRRQATWSPTSTNRAAASPPATRGRAGNADRRARADLHHQWGTSGAAEAASPGGRLRRSLGGLRLHRHRRRLPADLRGRHRRKDQHVFIRRGDRIPQRGHRSARQDHRADHVRPGHRPGDRPDRCRRRAWTFAWDQTTETATITDPAGVVVGTSTRATSW